MTFTSQTSYLEFLLLSRDRKLTPFITLYNQGFFLPGSTETLEESVSEKFIVERKCRLWNAGGRKQFSFSNFGAALQTGSRLHSVRFGGMNVTLRVLETERVALCFSTWVLMCSLNWIWTRFSVTSTACAKTWTRSHWSRSGPRTVAREVSLLLLLHVCRLWRAQWPGNKSPSSQRRKPIDSDPVTFSCDLFSGPVNFSLTFFELSNKHVPISWAAQTHSDSVASSATFQLFVL